MSGHSPSRSFFRRSGELVRAAGRIALPLICLAVWSGAGATALFAQDTASYFRTNCYSCHTIGGGRVTGPDLKDVTQRQERSWLVNFMLNPKEVIDSGDPYAQQLYRDSRGVIMPRVPGLDQSTASALLDLIEAESRLEESNFLGLQLSDKPISPEEVRQGRSIFEGSERPRHLGPACRSCHTVTGLGVVGGGRIGPDLTKVFERMGGRRALATWLMAPATPTMSAAFAARPLAPEDITVLSAFLEDRAKNETEQSPAGQRAAILFLGLAGSFVCLAAVGHFRRRRFRGERRN
jgi:cytochrome c2